MVFLWFSYAFPSALIFTLWHPLPGSCLVLRWPGRSADTHQHSKKLVLVEGSTIDFPQWNWLYRCLYHVLSLKLAQTLPWFGGWKICFKMIKTYLRVNCELWVLLYTQLTQLFHFGRAKHLLQFEQWKQVIATCHVMAHLVPNDQQGPSR